MKKRLYKFFSIVICLFTLLCQSTPIFAQNEVTLEVPFGFVSGKWSINFTQTGDWGGSEDFYGRAYINGKRVYCTEPLVNIHDGASYTIADLPSFTGSVQTAKQLEYISALGYGFNGDTSAEMDFATQIRIWQELVPGIVDASSIHPDIQAKINEINERLYIMNNEVSFNRSSIVLYGYGEEFAQTLSDTNGCFVYYNDYATSQIHTRREGNSLIIWAEKGDEKNVDILYDCLYLRNQAGTSIAYRSSTSQNVVYLQGADPRAVVLNVQVQTGAIQFSKEDSDVIRAQGDATLENASFDVIDTTTNNVVGTLVTDAQGQTNRLEDLPVNRTYTLRETSAPKGYVSMDDKTIDYSQIDVNSQGEKVYSEAFKEDVITGQIQLEKIITDGQQSEIVTPEANAEFVIVLKKYVEQYGSVEQAMEHTEEMSIKEWNRLVTDENGKAISSPLAYGTYVIQQTKGQDETKLLKNSFEVSIQNQNEVISYTINNVPTRYYIRLVKVDSETKEAITLNSASFKIKDAKGNFVTMRVGNKTYDTFATTSDNGIGLITTLKGNTYYLQDEDKGVVTTPLTLKAGKYTLEEVTTPDGFISSKSIPFTISKDYVYESSEDIPTIEIVVENTQPKGKVEIQKTVSSPSFDCSNIEFTLYAKEDIVSAIDGSILYKAQDVVGTYLTNEKGQIEIDNLVMGHYYIKETKTLDGLVLDEESYDVNFEIEDEKTLEYVVSYNIENQPTRVSFSKTDVTGQEELEGATLTLYNSKQEVVESWISTKEAHMIEGLVVGQTYTLEETIAIDGYVKATNVEFKVLNSKEVQHISMIDKIVDVSKVDLGGQEVVGAKLQVFDEEGKEVDAWTSTSEAHKIHGLEEGKKYVLHEDLAPVGYEMANDIEFVVSSTKENGHLTMVDKKLDTVAITKYDATSKEELPGAKLKVTDQEGNVVDEWISTKEAHLIEGLYVGQTYTLTEIQAPELYAVASSIEFTIEDNGEVVQKVNMYDELKSVVHTRVMTHRFLFGMACTISLLAMIVCLYKVKEKN